MKRIIIIILTVLSLTAISAEPNQQGKTVTVPQEYLDSLEHAASLATQQKAVAQEAVYEATDQLRSEMESRYNSYLTHVGTLLGIIGVVIALVASAIGYLLPKEINKKFEETIKEKINSHDKKIEEAQNKTIETANQINITAETANKALSDIQDKIKEHEKQIMEVQQEIERAKESAQTSAENANEAKESAEKVAQSIQYFNQAFNETDLDKKIELYTKAIELNPNYAEAYNNRGSAYDDKEDFDKAIEDYTKAIELDPNLAEAYYNRGNAYAHKGDFDKAIEDYTKAIELNPNHATAYYNRAFCYIKLAEKETDKAKAKEYYQKAWDDCDTGLSLNPDEEVRKALEERKRLCEERLKNL